jgi:hypothetical protein
MENKEMEELIKSYNDAIARWKYGCKETEESMVRIQQIIDRKFWLCSQNPTNGIILVGSNPSYDESKRRENKNEFCSLAECEDHGHSHYWNRWKENLQFLMDTEKGKAGYVDLFPLKLTDQTEFEKIPLELRAELLRVTQYEIEKLHPQLIIHANKKSKYYYGTIPETPWMGYELERIDIPSVLKEKYGEAYVIKGLIDTDKRINYHDVKKTVLSGTYLFICPYQNARFLNNKPEKKLHQEDIKLLCDYFNIK